MSVGTVQKRLAAAAIILLFFALWEASSRLYLVNPAFVPPFSNVARNVWRMAVHKDLLHHVALSLFRASLGTAIAAALGIPLGFLASGGCERFRIALGSLMDVLSQVSPFILFHVLILFMGIGELPKVTIIAWACVWPVLFHTADGVEHIDRLLLKAGRGFGGGRLALFFKVILPAVSPKVFAGIRISAGYSLFLLVAAEMMGGESGLGWLVSNEQRNFQIENIFSIALVIALLGILVDGTMVCIQKLLVPYDLQEYVNSSQA
jgi:NitT/TauT family transport system permease protein